MKIWRTVLPALLALSMAGCRGCAPEPETSAPAAEALEPIPEPDLSNLSEEVRSQIAAERAALAEVATREAAPPAELAERFGSMGRHYHAYELSGAAEACYRNAIRLAPEEFRWHYLLAVLAQDRGDASAAVESLERALRLRPGDPAAVLRLGEVRLGEAQPEAARQLFEQMLEVEGAVAAAHYGLGRIASTEGDFPSAIRHFERVLELQPDAYNVHYPLALAYQRVGDREAAARHLELRDAGLVDFPDPLLAETMGLVIGVGPVLQAALTAMGHDDYAKAAEEYRAALEIEPENLTALRGLSLALRNAGDVEGAIEASRATIRLYPKDSLGHLELGTVLLDQGMLDEAIEVLRAASELVPDFKEAHFNLGVALSRAGRWEEAARQFREVLRIDERFPMARYDLAVALDEQGRHAEAIAALRRVVEETPNKPLPRQRLGDLLARTGDVEGAREQHRAVLKLDAPPQEKGLAHYQLGRLAATPEEAITHFRQAFELFPELWQARFALANALKRAARFDDAAAEYSWVVQVQPENPEAWKQGAEALVWTGKFAEARRFLEAGLAASPQAAQLAHDLARLLATAPEEAVRDGAEALRLAQGVFDAHPCIEHAETVVMALAELGRFPEAVDWQRKIVAKAESEGRVRDLPRLRRNLARYERGEPAREGA